ncbi:MAG: S41 family peptidase [Dehalococcoidia bacterium]|nr:S41 family peptidase [Dehalococcoidia bacterium]
MAESCHEPVMFGGNMNNKRSLLPTLLVVLLIVLSFGAGFAYSKLFTPAAPELPAEFDTLGEVWELLSLDYVNKDALDPEELSRGAIEGMLEALGDPYTSYLESYQLASSDLEGSFEGIGAIVSMEDGELTVVSPIAGGPAERQGMRAGDKILEVDGEPTSEMNLIEAVLKIRGDKGTTVTLLILHQGETTPVAIEIVREEIKLDSVYLDMLPEDTAHIRITHFVERTPDELTEALNSALQSDAWGIILDLRGNPGGYLDVVVDVADEFLDGGIILYEADSEGDIIEEWTASSGGLATDLPLIVLVDGGSASGSEVLAGALRDHGRATLIGTKTYGKGSVNILHELSDHSALYVTMARWLTPDRHLIEGVGLIPDIEVEITEEDIASGRDPQLERAIEYLQAQ